MAERPKAAVLKTADPKGSGGSNPSPSASSFPSSPALLPRAQGLESLHSRKPRVERWPSGRRRQIANLLRGYNAPPRVRIPASPPHPSSSSSFLFRGAAALLWPLLFLLTACQGPTWKIQSRPPKATVFLDGRERGKTPVTIEGVYPGRREILLSSPGTLPRRFLLEVRPGPPGWIFPLDFPVDLGLALFTDRNRTLTLDLPAARNGEIAEPGREEIQALAARALELSRRRVD